MPRVAFLGPPGTFTEEALLSEPDLADSELIARAPVPEVIAAVESGEADLGIVPLENSIEGAVTVTLDALAFTSDLLIQREIVRPISLNLVGRPGTRLRDVRTVVSLPYASAQCRDWLHRTLPDVEPSRRTRLPTPSSAPPARARKVSRRSGRGWRPSSTASR